MLPPIAHDLGPPLKRANRRSGQAGTVRRPDWSRSSRRTRASPGGSIWAVPWAVSAADGQAVLMQTNYGLVPIGWVQSALKVLGDAPNQREGAPGAWIRFNEQVDELSTHPEDDMSQPLTGVFSTCSPNRPNPIGLHRARIMARDGLRIEVDALEAIDGTPVVDVKPAIGPPA
jgi:hypothetical protein